MIRYWWRTRGPGRLTREDWGDDLVILAVVTALTWLWVLASYAIDPDKSANY
jgi:hypothetical protein